MRDFHSSRWQAIVEKCAFCLIATNFQRAKTYIRTRSAAVLCVYSLLFGSTKQLVIEASGA
jgi:hypothetical protein